MYLACYMKGERVVVFCSVVDLFSNNGALIFISSFPCGGGSIESNRRLCYWFVGAIFIVGASKSWSFGEILEKFLWTTGRSVARFWTITFSWNDNLVKQAILRRTAFLTLSCPEVNISITSFQLSKGTLLSGDLSHKKQHTQKKLPSINPFMPVVDLSTTSFLTF